MTGMQVTFYEKSFTVLFLVTFMSFRFDFSTDSNSWEGLCFSSRSEPRKAAAGFWITAQKFVFCNWQRSCTHLLKYSFVTSACYPYSGYHLNRLIYDIMANYNISDSRDLHGALRSGLSVCQTSQMFRHLKRYYHLAAEKTERYKLDSSVFSDLNTLTFLEFFPESLVSWSAGLSLCGLSILKFQQP